MSYVMPEWIVILPPFLVLVVALTTRSVLTALFTGILTSALLATHFSVPATVQLIMQRLYKETHIQNIFWGGPLDHIYTLSFLLILGIIIALITHSGGISAYINYIKPKIKSARAAQTVSLLLSCCFFIDDYLNSLVVGNIMRPITDHFKIPRVKLAFLLAAMSAPLCVLIPASSWVAMTLVNLQASGITDAINTTGQLVAIQADPLHVYIRILPYLFYPLFLIFSAWLIVRSNISYAGMFRQEQLALTTGNLFGNKPPLHITSYQSLVTDQSLFDFFAPMAIFVTTVAGTLLYTGKWVLLGGSRSLLGALQEANIFFALLFASSVTLICALLLAALRRKISLVTFKHLIIDGWKLMRNSLLVLLFAWTLGSLLQHDLKTGQYVAHVLLNALPTWLLPVSVFITALLISASIGSAWGTIVIMLPLIIPTVALTAGQQQTPLLLHQVTLLFPVVANVLAGAIAGGHISPISDATVMTATSASSYHLDHVATQLWYVFPAIVGTLVASVCTGLLHSYSPVVLLGFSFSSGLLVTISLLYLFNYFLKPRIHT